MGGIPLPIPILPHHKEIKNYINLIDGLLLSGGQDIHPSCYDETPSEEIKKSCVKRDKWEMELFQQAYYLDLPVLGICRGMQLMNVALGGTLYQDIEKQFNKNKIHFSKEGNVCIIHIIKIKKNSKLNQILCGMDEIKVNSYHHQAINKLAPPFNVGAESNGIIEAIEAPKKDYMIGVQWHPEELINNNSCFQYLFGALISNAKKE